MSQAHTQSDQAKARNGKSTLQQVEAEDRAAWEGMTAQPPQQSHTSAARRVLNKCRNLAESGMGALRRALKTRS